MKIILEVIDAVVEKRDWEEPLKHFKELRSEIEDEINLLNLNDYDLITSKLFPLSIPINETFYSTAKKLQLLIGYNSVSKKFLFAIWNNCLNRISPSEKHQLLNLLLNNESIDFWTFIQILPDFCKEVELEPDFASGWFYNLAIRIKNDLAGGPFYEGFENYVLNESNNSKLVFEKYLSEISINNEITRQRLASIILGILRSKKETDSEIAQYVNKWDCELKHSNKIQLRICYYKSLVNTFILGALSIQSLDIELNDMLNGEISENEEAFITLYRCFLLNQQNSELLRFIKIWYNKVIPKFVTDKVKYYIIDLFWRLLSKENIANSPISVKEANIFIEMMLPLPEDQNGTWMQLEDYIVDRLKNNINDFKDIIDKVLLVDCMVFCDKFSKHFNHLKNEVISSSFIQSLSNYIFSREIEKRKFGFLIYNILPEQKQQTINQIEVSEPILELIIYEFINYPTLSKQVSDYLLMLEPYYRDVNEELQGIFKNEMALQALNYPGECLERWKKIDLPSSLLKDIIEISDNYFNNLKSNSELTISTFSFPGYDKALKRKMQLFSGQVSKDSKSKSIFYNLARSTEVLYGTSWSILNEKTLGEKSDFKEFSTSIEFPRLEIIDPEGMALRKLHIKSMPKR